MVLKTLQGSVALPADEGVADGNVYQLLKRDEFFLPTHKTGLHTSSLRSLASPSALTNHVHQFDARQHTFGGSK